MRKTAILIINSLQNGGAERVVVNQAIELNRQGIHVVVILVHNLQYYTLPSNIEVITLSCFMRGIKKALNIPLLVKKLDSVIEQIMLTDNIVLMTSNLPYSHWICRFSKYREKILFVMHNPQFHFPHSQSSLFKSKIRYLYQQERLIAVSEGVRDELLAVYKLRPERILTIYNPINFDEIEELKSKKIADIPREKFLLFVGRLTPPKNIPRLIQAFFLSDLYKDYLLVILGTGEEKDSLVEMSRKLGIRDRIVFYGWSDNVYAWMKNAELFVCSSDYESFGMAIAEALCCGCKVVSTDCDYGPREILRGKLSTYLAKLDANDLSEKIVLALKQYPTIDSSLLMPFKVETVVSKYLQAYKEKDFNNSQI